MNATPTREELEAAHCWEADDRVPGPPAMTDFRRSVRLRQARWREANGHPIGTNPYRPRPGQPSRLIGSRMPLDYAIESGANLVTPAALDAARARTSFVEPFQSFDRQRLWADLLSSEALAFNLFGDIASDPPVAGRAIVRRWWPEVRGAVREVRFAHSPGRLDPAWLNSLRAFDAAFVIDLDGGSQGILAVDVKYHEWLKPEIPRPENLWRYREVAERSGAFPAKLIDELAVGRRYALAVMWLEHLLVLSMLQHPSGAWAAGRYVVLHPAGNVSVMAGVERYRGMLADDSTFLSATLEDLLAAGVLPERAERAVSERYVGMPVRR